MANLNAWAASVDGRYIDVDGWAGAQCWDLSQHWLTTCNGGTLWTQPSKFPGLAAGSWEVATGIGPASEDLRRHVTVHPGTERGLPGDLIIWAYGSPDYPISHTAVLIRDDGPSLLTMSQNSSPARTDLPGYSPESSGPSIYQDLTRDGLLGFLRPKTTISGQANNITPITPKEDTLSAAEVDTILNAIGDKTQEVKEYVAAHMLHGTTSGGVWRPGATKLLIENQRRINAANAELAGVKDLVKQLAKGQGVVIDYKKIDASIQKALADGIEITGTIAAKDGGK